MGSLDRGGPYLAGVRWPAASQPQIARALIERELNAHVEGYQFRVGRATLSPTLALEIQQLTMSQTDIPIRRSQKSPGGV